MPNNNLKNIVVLNNLPSNLIDEAIIILKSKKVARKLELIDNKTVPIYKKNKESNDYVIKEAEDIINNYFAKIEKNQCAKTRSTNIESKYKRIRRYSILISFLLIICIVKIFLS